MYVVYVLTALADTKIVNKEEIVDFNAFFHSLLSSRTNQKLPFCPLVAIFPILIYFLCIFSFGFADNSLSK